MPPLVFNAVGIYGQLEELMWYDPTQTAYVISIDTSHSGTGLDTQCWVSTVDFSGSSPAVSGPVAFVGQVTTPHNVAGTGPKFYGTFRALSDPKPNNCLDASGRLWSTYAAFAPISGHNVLVAFMFITDPTSGSSVQQLTSFDGDVLHKSRVSFKSGLYSFMAGGVNYLWATVFGEFSLPTSVHLFILIVDVAAPSFSYAGPSLNPAREYSAPIFDNVQYAYLIESGQNATGSIVRDDGSFNIIQYSVTGGAASINQTFNFTNARSIGRAYWGIYNSSTNTIYLFTTGGAVQVFDPITGSISPAVEGLFSAVILANGLEFPNTTTEYFFVNPGMIAGAQSGEVDLPNCTMMGSSPVGPVVQNFGGTGPYDFRGVRRLNLSCLTVLDDRYPQSEWLSGTATPAGMTGSVSQHISGLNSLLWVTRKPNGSPGQFSGNQLLQLIWPSQGDCAAAPPVTAKQPNTFTIT